MDIARRVRPDDEFALRTRPAEATVGMDGIEKVLRFALPGREAEAGSATPSVTANEITRAIELVHEAAETIRAAEERAREGEARTQALVQRAGEELRSAETRIQAAEAKLRAAEARAHEAEARAKEAEGWLRQIFSTISEELPVRR